MTAYSRSLHQPSTSITAQQSPHATTSTSNESANQDLFASGERSEESGFLDGLMGDEAFGSATEASLGFSLLGWLAGCSSETPDVESPEEDSLQSELDALAERSPAFAEALAKVERDKFQWAAPGTGSANTPDGSVQIDPAKTKDPVALARTLAHEMGHAAWDKPAWVYDPAMTREQYVDANTKINLHGEAEATIMELRVRDDLMQGPEGFDMGITGKTAQQKIAVWERYKRGEIDRDTARDEIATLFARGETPSRTDPGVKNYEDHYKRSHQKAWDKANP